MRALEVMTAAGLLCLVAGCRGTQAPKGPEPCRGECVEARRLAAEVEDLRERLVRAEEDLDESRAKSAHLSELVEGLMGPPPVVRDNLPAVEGTVTRSEESLNTVWVAIDSSGELRTGDRMIVYRGEKYVGALIIDNRGEGWVSGHMDLGVAKAFPRKGDVATTEL